MTQFNEVLEPIICDAYLEPTHHWVIEKGSPPVKALDRRDACYYYRPPARSTGAAQADEIGTRIPLDLVNEIRMRVKLWTAAGAPGVTPVTAELLAYWTRDERERRLFFCQREAAETIVFLVEARADFRQGRSPVTSRGSSSGTPARWRRGAARPRSWACSRRGASSTRSPTGPTSASRTSS